MYTRQGYKARDKHGLGLNSFNMTSVERMVLETIHTLYNNAML